MAALATGIAGERNRVVGALRRAEASTPDRLMDFELCDEARRVLDGVGQYGDSYDSRLHSRDWSSR